MLSWGFLAHFMRCSAMLLRITCVDAGLCVIIVKGSSLLISLLKQNDKKKEMT